MFASVISNPSHHQLPYKAGWQGIARLEADGALAGVPVLEIVLESLRS
jgi:hypothetical protein